MCNKTHFYTLRVFISGVTRSSAWLLHVERLIFTVCGHKCCKILNDTTEKSLAGRTASTSTPSLEEQQQQANKCSRSRGTGRSVRRLHLTQKHRFSAMFPDIPSPSDPRPSTAVSGFCATVTDSRFINSIKHHTENVGHKRGWHLGTAAQTELSRQGRNLNSMCLCVCVGHVGRSNPNPSDMKTVSTSNKINQGRILIRGGDLPNFTIGGQ